MMARCVLVRLLGRDYFLFGYKVPQEAKAASNQLQFTKTLSCRLKAAQMPTYVW